MTLDELFEKYHEAWSAVARQTDGDRQSAGRAGVTAIVRALRDEFREEYGMWERFTKILGSDAAPAPQANTVELSQAYVSQIEQSRTEAHRNAAPAFYAGQDPKISLNTDAAPVCDVCNGRGEILVRTMHDPDGPGDIDTCPECYVVPDAAPAECVWTGEEYVTYSTSCESEHEVDPHKAPPTYCPSCGKPIRFTEAK